MVARIERLGQRQCDALVLLRQIATDQGAILDRLPALPADGAEASANGHAAHNGVQRS